MDKTTANEILGAHERHTRGECTRDRALEDITRSIEKFADERPIVGYVKSGTLKQVLGEIVVNASEDKEKSYMMNVRINKNEYETIKRMLNSMYQR